MSHWWGEPVRDFIFCLTQHTRDHFIDEDTPFWVCAYANNQWALGEAVTVDPAESSFFKAMELTQGTVSIIDERAVCYTRIWCSYEVYRALVGARQGRRYQYAMYTAIEHVGADDHHHQAVGVVEGLAAPDNGQTARKASRERFFPQERLDRALEVELQHGAASVEADKRHILNSIVGASDLEAAPLAEHARYSELNATLHTPESRSRLSSE